MIGWQKVKLNLQEKLLGVFFYGCVGKGTRDENGRYQMKNKIGGMAERSAELGKDE